MKNAKHLGRRGLALLLALMLCVGLLGTSVFAIPSGWSTSRPGGSYVYVYGTDADGL